MHECKSILERLDSERESERAYEEILLAMKLVCGLNSLVTLHYYDAKGIFFLSLLAV